MRTDTYGPMLLELFTTTPEPLSITQAAETVGCSKQRAYSWVENNRQLLVTTGRLKYGGIGYMAKRNPVVLARRGAVVSGEPAVIEVDAQFTVASIAVVGGKVVLTVVDDRGGSVRLQVLEE